MLVLLAACHAPDRKPPEEPGTRIVGYQPTWAPLDPAVLDPLTHVCLAFANPVDDRVEFSDAAPAEIQAFVDAAHAAGVQVLGSIAGGSDSPRVAGFLEPDRVDGFVADVVDLADRYDLDGIDVDIEGDAIGPTYEPFVVALGQALGDRPVTAALATWNGDDVSDAALAELDFVNLMAYDDCGPWSDACEHSTVASAEHQLAYWTGDRGLPADRVVLGVPFYGYCWGAACPAEALTFAEIALRWPDRTADDWIEEPDLALSYNGTATIAEKTAIGADYGGVMVWELTQDAPDPSLMDVIAGP